MENSYRSPYESWRRRKANPAQNRFVMLAIGIFTVVTVYATVIIGNIFLTELTPNVSADARGFLVMYGPYVLTLFTFLAVTYFTSKPIFKSYFGGMRGNNLLYMLVGSITGFLITAICILPALMCSDIKLAPIQPTGTSVAKVIGLFILLFVQGAADEIAFRGYLFRNGLNRMPLWMNMAYSSLLYGLMYIYFTDFHLLSIINIIIASLGFCFCVHYFESLWMAIGMHVMWNFSQFFIFGLPHEGNLGQLSLWHVDETVSGLFFNSEMGILGSPFGLLVTILFTALIWFMGKNFRQEMDERD
ncbi:MAG: CPBP family intramembrane metalloprotease [Erysipelotrichaceae bacterium]|nr:CPBP family intramembrane metalloprotease [Erysipelotrichaceae bacterium]